MTHRLSLSAALRHIYDAGALGASTWPRIDMIPGHHLRVWDCVIVERRFDGDPRLDVMGAICDRREGGLPPELDRRDLLDALPLLDRWRRRVHDDPLADAPLLWFEWDILDACPQPPLASICVSNAIVGGRAARQAPTADHPRRSMLDAAYAALVRRDGEHPWPTALRGAIDALHPAGELLHIAGLGPRGLDRLRLTLHVQVDAIPRWLRAIAWPGDADELTPVLTELAAPSARICVQIELTPEVGPYLAFETPELRSLSVAARSGPRLRALAELAALPATALDGFARWPGIGELPMPDGTEPVLRHCYAKLVRQRPGEWAAKGYVGVTALAMTPAALHRA